MAKFLVFFLLFALALVLIVLAVREVVNDRKNRNGKCVSCLARVCARRTELVAGRTGGAPAKTAYYASFSLDSGKTAEFPVTEEMYDCLREGDTGFIAFEGNMLISFETER